MNPSTNFNALGRLLWRGLASALAGAVAIFDASASELHARWKVGAEPLVFGQTQVTNGSGQVFTFTRWDVILSEIALHRSGGGWITRSNWVAVFQGGVDSASTKLSGLPAGSYDRVRLHVGLPPAMNHRDAAEWPADHPLNPARSGLHWGWAGGWVFCAIEGQWNEATHRQQGFSFHIATDAHRVVVEQAVDFNSGADSDLEIQFDASRLVGGAEPLVLKVGAATTHSREGDEMATALTGRLKESVRFAVVSRSPLADATSTPLTHSGTAVTAQPYRLEIPSTFPRPALPIDNPLTEEGVALGRRLFFEPMLSKHNQQTCATCHDPAKAFTEGAAVSVGVDGRSGTRNAMPLFNLAWKTSYFWDGRARTLREQVLQPITNPDEMAETLESVLEKLRRTSGAANYPESFRGAFGTSEITADRLARALEQFLLVQVSGNSKFDRALRGEGTLTEVEARGFELFRTEFDPARGLRGADCFHCHGGSLFQSQRFGNNGLSTTVSDRGRAGVTGQAGHEGLFAVPSLRNVVLTAPYMHDGRFKTLEEVVAHYCTGVKPSPTLDPNLAKHPEGGLRLGAEDQAALVAFLQTLTELQ